MINVKVKRQKGEIIAFKMSGHANSGPYGHDLVCAAASAVSFGAVNAIIDLCQTELIIDQKENGGYLFVQMPDTLLGQERLKAQIILEAMVISLQTIERDYGEFITIE